MKKIIALILVLCCLFAVVSCKKDPAPTPTPQPGPGTNPTPDTDPDVQAKIDEITAMFASLVPTQSVTSTKLTFGIVTLETLSTLTVGTVDGAEATILETVNETLSDVKGGGNLIVKSTENLWYVAGRGTSANKGKTWDAEGTDFAPTPGSIRLNLSAEYLATKEYNKDTETLTVTVTKENAANVLGGFTPDVVFGGDVKIVISTAGGRIVSIEVSYLIPEKTITYAPYKDYPEDLEEMQVPDVEVVIKVDYTYDYQPITMG